MKVASGDINNMGLLAQVASFGKPVILSTGASDQSEVKKAVEFLIKRGNRNLLLMHCLSEYPAPLSRVGWYSIPFLLEHFGFPVGFSDHTQGVYGAITAFSLGARIIEKHFTLDKNDHAVDSPISADAGEFAEMVQVIREIEKGMGYMEKIPTEEEVQGNTVGRRGLYFAQSLPKGKRICEEDLIALRPQNGFSPANIFQVIGKKLKNPVEKLDSVSGEDFV
jgi:sialic acid synthase SpsE